MSSEDVNPTGGRYGYVVTSALGAGVETIILPVKLWTDLALGQIYSLTRIATLITVILNMIDMDVVSQPNCQVCLVPYFFPPSLPHIHALNL